MQDPGAILEHFKRQLEPGGVAFVSTPNVLTLAPDGKRSDNPWHVYEYRPEEYYELCAEHFGSVEFHGVFHARKLKAQDLAIKAGLGLAAPEAAHHEAVLHRFVPAINVGDFALREGAPEELHGSLDLVAVLRP